MSGSRANMLPTKISRYSRNLKAKLFGSSVMCFQRLRDLYPRAMKQPVNEADKRSPDRLQTHGCEASRLPGI